MTQVSINPCLPPADPCRSPAPAFWKAGSSPSCDARRGLLRGTSAETPRGRRAAGGPIASATPQVSRSDVTNDALIMAKQYATQALNPLMAWGIASRIRIEASYVSAKVMRLAITVTGPGTSAAAAVQGTAMPDSGWLWQEYQN